MLPSASRVQAAQVSYYRGAESSLSSEDPPVIQQHSGVQTQEQLCNIGRTQGSTLGYSACSSAARPVPAERLLLCGPLQAAALESF